MLEKILDIKSYKNVDIRNVLREKIIFTSKICITKYFFSVANLFFNKSYNQRAEVCQVAQLIQYKV